MFGLMLWYVISLGSKLQCCYLIMIFLILEQCIVQKSETDPGDFDEEAPKMASVYGNATLTITFTDNVRFGSVRLVNDT